MTRVGNSARICSFVSPRREVAFRKLEKLGLGIFLRRIGELLEHEEIRVEDRRYWHGHILMPVTSSLARRLSRVSLSGVNAGLMNTGMSTCPWHGTDVESRTLI